MARIESDQDHRREPQLSEEAPSGPDPEAAVFGDSLEEPGGEEPVVAEVGPGEAFGEPRFDQVRPADGADQQRAAGEHGDGGAVLLQHVGGVVRGVAGRGECAQGEPVVDGRAVPVVHGCPLD